MKKQIFITIACLGNLFFARAKGVFFEDTNNSNDFWLSQKSKSTSPANTLNFPAKFPITWSMPELGGEKPTPKKVNPSSGIKKQRKTKIEDPTRLANLEYAYYAKDKLVRLKNELENCLKELKSQKLITAITFGRKPTNQ